MISPTSGDPEGSNPFGTQANPSARSRAADGTPVLQCVPPPVNTCANTFELCTTAADYCSPTDLRINSRCSQIIR